MSYNIPIKNQTTHEITEFVFNFFFINIKDKKKCLNDVYMYCKCIVIVYS